MPTVLSVDGFTVRILLPPREHGPAHVQVYRLVDAHRVLLLAAWRTYHGNSKYDRRAGRIVLELTNGYLFAFSVGVIAGLRVATPAQSRRNAGATRRGRRESRGKRVALGSA